MSAKAVAISSGGLDSTTLVYDMMSRDFVPHVLSFDYGQRHAKELDYAKSNAEHLGLQWDCVPLPISSLIARSGSSLVNTGQDVPDGHYAEESMKHTVVPNRNMMMLSIAAAIAVANEAGILATGVHSGDHFIYPDCRPVFIQHVEDAINTGNEGFMVEGGIMIYTPFLYRTKTDIARRAKELGVPIEKTWSCYKGGQYHCGRCGTCVERQEALWEAGVDDPTAYVDSDYWRTVTKIAEAKV